MDGASVSLPASSVGVIDLVSRSVTLVGEADRKVLKAAIKRAAGEDQIRHRIVPPEAVSKWAKKLEDMKQDVIAVLQEEKEEKHVGPKNLFRL
jgi:hypothetical protein